MRIQAWSPTFNLIEETTLVPVWITLPKLPWHCFYQKNYDCCGDPYWKSFRFG